NQGDASPAYGQGLRCRPLSAHAFIHNEMEAEELLMNPFAERCSLHPHSIRDTHSEHNTNLLKLFFRGSSVGLISKRALSRMAFPVFGSGTPFHIRSPQMSDGSTFHESVPRGGWWTFSEVCSSSSTGGA